MSCGWARSHRCAKKKPRLKDFEPKHHRAWASQTTLRGLKNCLANMSNFSLSQSSQLGRSNQNESWIQMSDVIMSDEPRHSETLPKQQERAPRRYCTNSHAIPGTGPSTICCSKLLSDTRSCCLALTNFETPLLRLRYKNIRVHFKKALLHALTRENHLIISTIPFMTCGTGTSTMCSKILPDSRSVDVTLITSRLCSWLTAI